MCERKIKLVLEKITTYDIAFEAQHKKMAHISYTKSQRSGEPVTPVPSATADLSVSNSLF